MRFAFSTDQRALQTAVADLLAGTCTSDDVRAAWATGWSAPRWKQLAEMGVIGLTVPEADGGMGMDELDLVLLLEEAGRVALPEPLLETVAVAAPLLRDVGGDLATTWLKRIAAGDAVVAVGLPGATLVTHADRADLVLLWDDDLAVHAVPRDQIVLHDQPAADRAHRVASVTWTPSAGTLLARNDHPARTLLRAADRGALGAAATLLGAGHQVIQMAKAYALQREQFGRPIGSFQAVKHHLASALVEVEFARPMVYRAAHAVARDTATVTQDVSGAKVLAAEAAQAAARAALQVHGAIGYTWEHDLHLWMKRIWSLAASWGTTAQHRDRLSDAIL